MSESTTPAQCTTQEWRVAAKAGLMTREQGTNHFDEAVHTFAEMVREEARAKIIRLEGEATVLRGLLSETTDVINTLIDDDDDSEGTGLLAALKEKCIAAITGVPA